MPFFCLLAKATEPNIPTNTKHKKTKSTTLIVVVNESAHDSQTPHPTYPQHQSKKQKETTSFPYTLSVKNI